MASAHCNFSHDSYKILLYMLHLIYVYEEIDQLKMYDNYADIMTILLLQVVSI